MRDRPRPPLILAVLFLVTVQLAVLAISLLGSAPATSSDPMGASDAFATPATNPTAGAPLTSSATSTRSPLAVTQAALVAGQATIRAMVREPPTTTPGPTVAPYRWPPTPTPTPTDRDGGQRVGDDRD